MRTSPSPPATRANKSSIVVGRSNRRSPLVGSCVPFSLPFCPFQSFLSTLSRLPFETETKDPAWGCQPTHRCESSCESKWKGRRRPRQGKRIGSVLSTLPFENPNRKRTKENEREGATSQSTIGACDDMKMKDALGWTTQEIEAGNETSWIQSTHVQTSLWTRRTT